MNKKEYYIVVRQHFDKEYIIKSHTIRGAADNHVGQLKHKYPNRRFAVCVVTDDSWE